MTLQARIYDGNRAKEVLDNEVFQQAFAAIEEELTHAWKTSPQRDEDGREKLFVALTMLGKVKLALTTTLETGTLALIEFRHQNPTVREQSRDFLGMSTSR